MFVSRIVCSLGFGFGRLMVVVSVLVLMNWFSVRLLVCILVGLLLCIDIKCGLLVGWVFCFNSWFKFFVDDVCSNVCIGRLVFRVVLIVVIICIVVSELLLSLKNELLMLICLSLSIWVKMLVMVFLIGLVGV